MSITENESYERGRADMVAELRAIGCLDDLDLRTIRRIEAERQAEPVAVGHPAIIGGNADA